MLRRTACLPVPALALALFAVLASPSMTAAQAEASEVVARLRPGQVIRVQAPGIEIDGGTVSGATGETLLVTQEGQEWVIDPRTIERLEVRGHPTGRNMLLYGLIGMAAGAGADKLKGERDGKWNGALIGLGAGGLFGAVLSSGEWTWKVRFPT